MILSLEAVLVDGSTPPSGLEPALPYEQDIVWPEAEDGELRVLASRQDGTPLDLTGGSLLLSVRRRPGDEVSLFSRQATVVDEEQGAASFPIVAADTLDKPLATYRYDVVYVDPEGGRHQVIPVSAFRLEAVVVRPADPVSVPAEQVPLALGPSWLSLGYTPTVQTDGTTAEQVLYETVWNFDDGAGGLADLFVRLGLIAHVTAGTATVRVRAGGTPGAADGTVLLALGPVSGLADAVWAASGTAARPAGTTLVKVTMQCSDAGERIVARGLYLRARGTP